jgi:hypothetical protein
MTRTVKLTSREPTDETLTALCQEAVLADDDGIIAWEEAHDATPDDATKALEALLREVREHMDQEPTAGSVRAAYFQFAKTETGAALIRQREERNDAG